MTDTNKAKTKAATTKAATTKAATTEELNALPRPSFIHPFEEVIHPAYPGGWSHHRASMDKHENARIVVRQGLRYQEQPKIFINLDEFRNGDTIFLILEFARAIKAMLGGATISVESPDYWKADRTKIRHLGYELNTAQQTIRHLRKEITTCRFGKWVSCEERMPDKDSWGRERVVLIESDGVKTFQMALVVGGRFASPSSRHKTLVGVTHWRDEPSDYLDDMNTSAYWQQRRTECQEENNRLLVENRQLRQALNETQRAPATPFGD